MGRKIQPPERSRDHLADTKDDNAKMLMALDFFEGYNDGIRLWQGECSEQQIILYASRNERHRTNHTGGYIYAAGVNAAASVNKVNFPWMKEEFIRKNNGRTHTKNSRKRKYKA